MIKGFENFASNATNDAKHVFGINGSAPKDALGDKGTATKDGQISQTTMFGGNGGSAFEDATTSANLREVRIRSGGRVDSIQCVYDNGGKTAYHGGQGGRDFIFYLDKDEAIITVNVWASRTINGIQLHTTRGRLSQHYGYRSSEPYICRGFEGHERALMGFRGRCAGEVDAIEVSADVVQRQGPWALSCVAVGEARGGYGGSQFDMVQSVGDPLKTMLKSINVRHGARIDGLECVFNSGRTSGHQGGQGANGGSFELNENERIVRIEGRAAERIDQLQFITNLDRRSNVFGGSGGSQFIWTPPSTDDNMCLLCFQGRAGRELDCLIPVWAVDPPIKFDLDITKCELPDPSQIGKPKEAWTSKATTENKTSSAVPRTLT